ncbi:MAG: hypothetical protein JXA07_12165 [Spirochaetes bacterium]|nr:hypothetical protein [Spirochaetota bacterium]
MPAKSKTIPSLPAFARRAAFALLLIAAPAFCLDQVMKLYICQTERDLEEITSWEYSDPEKYRQATKDGKLMPLDAARESAATVVALDKIRCDSENQVVIEREHITDGKKAVRMDRLSGPELAAYCPRTLKKYGDLCR